MAMPWYGYNITQSYGKNGEYGVDIGTPFHTPITALYAGQVRWAGRTEWSCGSSGGEITIVCNVPGYGVMTSYYLHVDVAYVKPGDTVTQGQVIALSGGQLSGGNWPVVNCPDKGKIYSNGPHTEFGFNAPWVSGPGKNVDPTFAIKQARTNTLPVTYPNGSTLLQTLAYGAQSGQVVANPTLIEVGLMQFNNLSSSTHRVISQPTGFDGICEAIDSAEQFPEWNWFNIPGSMIAMTPAILVRSTIMFLCGAIAVAVIWGWISGPVGSIAEFAGNAGIMTAAPEAAPAISMAEAPQTKAK